jgi:hypothetical protein
MTTHVVQEWGCTALPEDVQARAGLYSGATFHIEASDDGSRVTLVALDRRDAATASSGVSCPISQKY